MSRSISKYNFRPPHRHGQNIVDIQVTPFCGSLLRSHAPTEIRRIIVFWKYGKEMVVESTLSSRIMPFIYAMNIYAILLSAIVHSLTEIFNMSIDTDQFPSKWKAARVIPLFKKGQRSMLDNYRPISIVSVVSKVMERVLYDQMY